MEEVSFIKAFDIGKRILLTTCSGYSFVIKSGEKFINDTKKDCIIYYDGFYFTLHSGESIPYEGFFIQ